MKDPAEVCRGLLRKARQDRIAVDALLSAQAFDGACFDAQQSAEKWLKTFLSYHSVPSPFTHNLAKLMVSPSDVGRQRKEPYGTYPYRGDCDRA